MTSMLIVLVGVLAVSIFSAKRLSDLRGKLVILGWLVLLVATVAPLYTAWIAVNPGDPIDSASVDKAEKSVKINVPEGYSVMVTATLKDIAADEDVDLDEQMSHYTLDLAGQHWSDSYSSVVYQAVERGVRVTPDGRAGLQSTSGFKLFGNAKDVQTRFFPEAPGELDAKISTWTGKAVTLFTFDVVKSPLTGKVLWPVIVVLGLIALVLDVKAGTDHLSIDVGFLVGPCFFIAADVTPLGGFQETLFAISAGALLGGAVLGPLGSLAQKLFMKEEIPARKERKSKTPAKPAANPEEPPKPQ